MSKIELILEKISLDLVNLLVFVIGIIIVLIGVFIKPDATITPFLSLTSNDLRTILISVGTSLIASSIIAFLSARYLIRQSKVKEIIDKWGLDAIYKTRAEMNESSNKHLEYAKDSIDIIALGMRGFRDAQGGLIEERIKKGIELRILTLNPDSIFVKQRESDENRVTGEIRKTIIDLYDWINDLKKLAPSEKNVQIKFYNTCPLDSYLRIDSQIYIGPNLYGKISQQTISYEFKENGMGFSYYKSYFETLWNNPEFCKDNYKEFK